MAVVIVNVRDCHVTVAGFKYLNNHIYKTSVMDINTISLFFSFFFRRISTLGHILTIRLWCKICNFALQHAKNSKIGHRRSPEKTTRFPKKSSHFPEKSTCFPEKSTLFPEKSIWFPEKSTLFPEKSTRFHYH